MNGLTDHGVSDTLGAVLLVAVVAMAVAIAAISVISHPVSEQAPALTADISASNNTITLRHNGGDSVARNQLKILVDNQDLTDQFSMAGAGTGWSAWSIGDLLTYTGSSAPGTVQIVYNSGSASRLLQSWGVAASGYTPVPTTAVTPTPTTTGTPVPVAGFTGTPTSGTMPLTVIFTDTSSNSPTSWLWTFGDSSTTNNSVQNPVHTYAAAGTYSVTLIAYNTAGNSTPFTRSNYITVMNPPPTVTGITPSSGNRGTTVTITNLQGTGFLTGASVKLNRSGYSDIPASSVIVTSSSQITCQFDLTGAAAGTWNVVVTNTDLQAGMLANGFTVNSPAPTLTARNPTSGNRGWPVTIISLTGTGFQPGAQVRLNRSGYPDVIATGVNVASSTSINAGTLNLLGVTAGTWYYVVINTDGKQSNTLSFTVNSPSPTVANVVFSPSSGSRGTTGLLVTGSGTYLQPGMAVTLTRSSTTITAYNVNVASPTSVTFMIDIPSTATTGQYTAKFTNTDGKYGSRSNRFTVT